MHNLTNSRGKQGRELIVHEACRTGSRGLGKSALIGLDTYGRAEVSFTLKSLGAPAARGSEALVQRVMNKRITLGEYEALKGQVKAIGVTPRFADVIKTFGVPEGETPAGFRIESSLEQEM